jgi:hypothetical protein
VLRPSPATLAVGVGVLLGLAGNLATSTVGEIPDGVRPWIWAATAVLGVTAILIEVYRNLAARAQTPSAGPDLADTADEFARRGAAMGPGGEAPQDP